MNEQQAGEIAPLGKGYIVGGPDDPYRGMPPAGIIPPEPRSEIGHPVIRGETETLIAGVPGLTMGRLLGSVAVAFLIVAVVTGVLILLGAGR